MTNSDHPKKNKTLKIVLISVAIFFLLSGIGIFQAFKMLKQSGITKGPDAMFGDQNLKSSVAMIELHKLRYGTYPQTLTELQFKGQWDELYLNGVSYQVSEDRMSYFIEVTRGWIGKPTLNMPAEFWQGTGYNPALQKFMP